jgi:hypothetical protein
MRGVHVREILGHGGGGKRHNQSDGDQKLLHGVSPTFGGLGAWIVPTGRPNGSIGMNDT